MPVSDHSLDSVEYAKVSEKYPFWDLDGKIRQSGVTAMAKNTIFYKPATNKGLKKVMKINKDAHYYLYEGYLCSALDTLTKHLIVKLELTALDDMITDLVVDGIIEMSGNSIISLMETLNTNEVADIYEEVS